LADANQVVAEQCKDVAAQFVEAGKAIQAKVDAQRAEVKKQFDAVALTAESNIDAAVAEMTTAINKMVEDAKAAQKAFEEENALKKANQAAYEKLSAELEQLYASVEAAKLMIAEDYFKVADIYNKHFEELIVRLDAVKADLAAKYEAVTLNENSELAVEGVAENIQAIVREAMFAANDEAYERLVGEVEVAKTKLAEADQKIKTEWSKVAPDFEGRIAEINTMIQAVLDDLAEKSENVELNSNSSVDLAAVEAAINQLLIDAQEAYISGIEDILVEGKEVVGVYTLGGKRVANPVKGWNIVKYNDGSFKKVYVK